MATKRKKVSLVIPTKNEEGCIRETLLEVPRDVVSEIIVVDGNSTDGTVFEVKHVLTKKDTLITQKSKGYGGAFLEGFAHAKGDVIVMMDADGSHNPKDIPKLTSLIDKGYEYVMASRYRKGGKSMDDTMIRFIGNKFFTWLTNRVHGTSVTDSLYLFTAITKQGLAKLRLCATGFEFCTEILVKAHKAGLRFVEVPTVERVRRSGQSKVNAFWHGLKILGMIMKPYND